MTRSAAQMPTGPGSPLLDVPVDGPLTIKQLAAVQRAQNARTGKVLAYNPELDQETLIPQRDVADYKAAGFVIGDAEAALSKQANSTEGKVGTAAASWVTGVTGGLAELALPDNLRQAKYALDAANPITKLAFEVAGSLAPTVAAGAAGGALAAGKFAKLGAAGMRVIESGIEGGVHAARDAARLKEPLTVERFAQGVGLGAVLGSVGEGAGALLEKTAPAFQRVLRKATDRWARDPIFKRTVTAATEAGDAAHMAAGDLQLSTEELFPRSKVVPREPTLRDVMPMEHGPAPAPSSLVKEPITAPPSTTPMGADDLRIYQEQADAEAREAAIMGKGDVAADWRTFRDEPAPLAAEPQPLGPSSTDRFNSALAEPSTSNPLQEGPSFADMRTEVSPSFSNAAPRGKLPKLPSEKELNLSAGGSRTRYSLKNDPGFLGTIGRRSLETVGLSFIPGIGPPLAKAYGVARTGLYAARKAQVAALNHEYQIAGFIDRVLDPTTKLTGKVVRHLTEEVAAPEAVHSNVARNTEAEYHALAEGVNKLSQQPELVENFYQKRYGAMLEQHREFYGALVGQSARQLQYLNTRLPRDPRVQAGLIPGKYVPPRSEQLKFIQAYRGVNDPHGAIADPTYEGIAAVNATHPETLRTVRELILARIADPKIQKKLTRTQRRQLSVVLGIPVTHAESSEFIAGLQETAQQNAAGPEPEQQQQAQGQQVNLGAQAKSFASMVAPPSQQNAVENMQ